MLDVEGVKSGELLIKELLKSQNHSTVLKIFSNEFSSSSNELIDEKSSLSLNQLLFFA